MTNETQENEPDHLTEARNRERKTAEEWENLRLYWLYGAAIAYPLIIWDGFDRGAPLLWNLLMSIPLALGWPMVILNWLFR